MVPFEEARWKWKTTFANIKTQYQNHFTEKECFALGYLYTVNAICSFCSLDKEQKELIDKFGTSKELINLYQIYQYAY